MGFFTARERTELGKSPQTRLRVQGRAQEQVRNLVRDDFAARGRPADNDVAGDVVSPLQRANATLLREIDDLIVELRRRREELLSESARMQSEIRDYAKLNQSTIQSIKIITERLANLRKAPEADADPMREPNVENTSNQENRESHSEEFAQPSAVPADQDFDPTYVGPG
jgi:hypothetical protein